ncbi:S1 family peptidase [Piscirickettsia litoralis]|uniref:S1 family peptidase n=1 Tax=Piscirickettsia litoralis TaxID=1891921 RepID=UPI000A8CA86B|nr:serine protease [Piscirickettsia litoralis]
MENLGLGQAIFFKFTKGDSYIITNRHVIDNTKNGKFYISQKGTDGKVDLGNHFPVEYKNWLSYWTLHPDPSIDLAIFPLKLLLNQIKIKPLGIKPYFINLSEKDIANEKLLTSLTVMEEIVMIGYPTGIWDEKHNLPIVRRGITATHAKIPYNGKPVFMIDAACFPGSSGSPVFLANFGSYVDETGNVCIGNRISLLGTLYAGPQHTATGEIKVVEVPTSTQPISESRIPMNLGLVIQSSKILDFEKII